LSAAKIGLPRTNRTANKVSQRSLCNPMRASLESMQQQATEWSVARPKASSTGSLLTNP
jgi:hypothetical protein